MNRPPRPLSEGRAPRVLVLAYDDGVLGLSALPNRQVMAMPELPEKLLNMIERAAARSEIQPRFVLIVVERPLPPRENANSYEFAPLSLTAYRSADRGAAVDSTDAETFDMSET